MKIINNKLLRDFDFKESENKPFPFHNFKGLINEKYFDKLLKEFPDIKYFKKEYGLKRDYGQASHNKYILHLEDKKELSNTWKEFIKELESKEVRSFIKTFLGTNYRPGFVWTISFKGSEISPHADSYEKLGSLLFYFNTDKDNDWDSKWGGDLLLLESSNEEFNENSSPKIKDFDKITKISNMNNSSVIFKKNERSWHGTYAISSPSDKPRRALIITFCKRSLLRDFYKSVLRKLRNIGR